MIRSIILSAVFAFSTTTFAFSNKDVILATKIIKADENALYVLTYLENQIGDPSVVNKVLLETAYAANPPKKELETPKLDALISLTGFDAEALSKITLPDQLNAESQQVLLDRVKNLMHVVDTIGTPEQREMLAAYTERYLEYKLDASDAVNAQGDPTLEHLNKVVNQIDAKAEYTVSEIKQFVQMEKQKAVEEMKTAVAGAKESIHKKIDETEADIKKAIEDSTSPILQVAEDTKKSVDFMKSKLIDEEFKKDLLKMSSYEDIDKMIEESKSCAPVAKDDRCSLMKQNQKYMQALSSANFKKDVHDASIGTLGMLQQISTVLGDADLAEDLSKAKFAVDTGYKISEALSKMNEQSTIGMVASMTNVVSMAFTVAGMFGGGGGEGDALQAISEQITQLRKEMHERFDAVEKQLADMGMGLNLKLDNTNGNIMVVLANQEILQELQEKTLLAIANLTTVQSNENIKAILLNLRMKKSLIVKENSPEYIREPISEAVSEFWNHITFTNNLHLSWQKSQDFTLASEEMINVVAQASSGLPQQNFAIFSLVDYMMNTKALGESASGRCSDANFNDVYLFNVLGSAMLPIFRATYDKGEVEYTKNNKYLHYLSTNDLNIAENKRLLEEPLEKIDYVIEETDRCLNSFATVDGVKRNIISYLISTYKTMVTNEFKRIMENAAFGKHMNDLMLAIRDPGQLYFKQQDKKFMALDNANPGARAGIDLSQIDVKKTYADNLLMASDKFYETYKNINPCSIYSSDAAVNLDPITLPRSTFDKIFRGDATKLSIAMGLNKAPKSLCYSIDPMVNGAIDHYVSTATLHFQVQWTDSVSYDVPVFLPANQLQWNIYEKTEEFAVDGVLDEHGEPTQSMTWTESSVVPASFVKYLNEQLPTAVFDCGEKDALLPAIEVYPRQEHIGICWVEGFKPDNNYFERVAIRFLPKGYFGLIPYEETPGYSDVRKMLAAQPMQEVFTTIQLDLQRCIRGALLGRTQCRFGDYLSGETLNNKVSFQEANRVNTILRLLTPLITGFKAEITGEERRDYFINLDTALSSPEEVLVRAAAKDGDRMANLLGEIETLEKTLDDMDKMSQAQIQIDARKLVSTDVYDAIKYYSKKTNEVFEAKGK